MGSVLLQTAGKDNAWLKEWIPCTENEERLCTVVALPGLDAAFSVTQYYPHTRSSDPIAFLVSLLLLIMLSFLVLVLYRISLPRLVPNLTYQFDGEETDSSSRYEESKYVVDHQKQLVMANLAYFGLANPRNTQALDRLLKERKVLERRLGYEIRTAEDIARARKEMTKSELVSAARSEGEGTWRHVRTPLFLLMFGALLFALYIAHEQLSSILQVVGSITALLVTVKSVVENYRNPEG
jgi:hypothetical protein